MKKDRNILLIGAIISLVLGGIYCFVTPLFALLPCISGIGMLMYRNKNDETFLKDSKSLLIFSVLSIFVNIISAVCGFIVYDNILSYKKRNQNIVNSDIKKTKPKEVISPEARKIDIILKVGVGLVVLSGFIFSTSNNGVFIDKFKPIFILLLSIMFYGLSFFFKVKIPIKKSEKIYYILSNIFLICFVISIGAFSLFGDYLSFDGDGHNLLISLILFTCGFVCKNYFKKYNTSDFNLFFYIFILLAILFIFVHLEFSLVLCIGIYSLLSFCIYFFKGYVEKELNDINQFLILGLASLFILCYFSVDGFELLDFSIGLVIILSIYYRYTNGDNNLLNSIVLTLFSSIFMFQTSCLLLEEVEYFEIVLFGIVLLANFLFYKSNNNWIKYSGFYVTLIFSVILLPPMFDLGFDIVNLLSPLVLLGYFSYILLKENDKIFEYSCLILQVVFSLILTFSICDIFIEDYSYVFYLIFFFIAMILSVIFNKKYTELSINKVLYYVIFILTSLVSLYAHNEVSLTINLITLVMLIGYKFYYNELEYNNYAFNFILILVFYVNIFSLLLDYLSLLAVSSIFVVILLGLALLSRKNKNMLGLLLTFTYIPYMLIIDSVALEGNIHLLLTRVPLMLLVYNLTVNLIQLNNKSKHIIEIVLLSIVFVSYIFNVDIVLGVITGVLALFMIYVGFNNERLGSLFYVGVGVTILNIIVQLSEFWSKIPLFVYLLVTGLILIGYVTYKEVNKANHKEFKISSFIKKLVPKDNENINVASNIINIALLLGIFVAYSALGSELNEFKHLKRMEKLYVQLEDRGIDSDKLFIWNNNDYIHLYLTHGYRLNLEEFFEIYEDLENDYYYSIDVYRATQSCVDTLKKGDSCNDNDYYHSFVYDYPPNKEYWISDYDLKIMNDDINYIEVDNYYNHFNGSVDISISYNTDDVDEVKFCLSNRYNSSFIVNVGNESHVANGEYCSSYRDSDGYFKLNVSEYYYFPDGRF